MDDRRLDAHGGQVGQNGIETVNLHPGKRVLGHIGRREVRKNALEVQAGVDDELRGGYCDLRSDPHPVHPRVDLQVDSQGAYFLVDARFASCPSTSCLGASLDASRGVERGTHAT